MVDTVQSQENGKAQTPAWREEGYRDVVVGLICATHLKTWFVGLGLGMDDGFIDHVMEESQRPVDDPHYSWPCEIAAVPVWSWVSNRELAEAKAIRPTSREL